MDPGDDLVGRARRHQQAAPGGHVVAGQAGLGHGGHIGQHRAAPGTGHRQGLELAGLDVAHRTGHRRGTQADLVAQDVVEHLRNAPVGHVHQVNAGLGLQQLEGQVGDAAVATGTKVDAARPGLGRRHQARDIAGRKTRVGHDHQRPAGHPRHRLEIVQQVEGRVLVQAGVDGMVHAHHQQGMAVGRRLGHQRRAQIAAGALDVVDHHRLAPQLGQPGAQLAGHDVGRRAHREGHHDAHRAGRVGLRPGRCGGGPGQGGQAGQQGQGGDAAGCHRYISRPWRPRPRSPWPACRFRCR